MKGSKVLGLIISVLQLGSAVALMIGMHTMLGVFSTALGGGDQGIEIQFTDPVTIPFTLTPVNNGFLEATMEVSMIMEVDGMEIASDSEVVLIPPGGVVQVELLLSIPLEEAQEYFQEESDLQWSTDIRVSTLYDLISFSNHMVIEGGMQ